MNLGSPINFFKSQLPRVLLSLGLSLAGLQLLAQSGTSSFMSITLPATAELAAIGSVNVSRSDCNVNFFQNNPALNSDSLSGWASASHLFYFAGTGITSIAYQQEFNRLGAVNFAVNHMNWGTLQGYDLAGNPTSTYQSGETAMIIGKMHQANHIRLGMNLKGVFSNLAGYRASALMVDIGGAFVHPNKDLTIGMAIKNLGFVLNEFSPTSSSRLPFDIQAGITYKPEHMPVRFSGTIDNLSSWDIPYYDFNPGADKPGTLDKVVSHLTFGTEVLVHRYFNILLGYNFLRHKELKLETAGGGSGFSLGALIKLKSLNFALSRSTYVTGGAYQLSLDVNTNKILMRN